MDATPCLVSSAARAAERRTAELERNESQLEAAVQLAKDAWLRKLEAIDMAENVGTDAMTAAIRIGDPCLIGRMCLKALDVYAERLALQDVYGYSSYVEPDVETECQALLTAHVEKMAQAL